MTPLRMGATEFANVPFLLRLSLDMSKKLRARLCCVTTHPGCRVSSRNLVSNLSVFLLVLDQLIMQIRLAEEFMVAVLVYVCGVGLPSDA